MRQAVSDIRHPPQHDVDAHQTAQRANQPGGDYRPDEETEFKGFQQDYASSAATGSVWW